METDSVRGMIATNTAPGTKSVSINAKTGVVNSPNPRPTDACRVAPRNAIPTQTSAAVSDTLRLFVRRAGDEGIGERPVAEHCDRADWSATPKHHEQIVGFPA
jgi:hypothetical protein